MLLRILCGAFAAVLIGLAIWLRDSPDSLFWGAVFGIGALWCLATAVMPRLVREVEGQILVLLCLGAALLGLWQYWPPDANWWHWDVLQGSETARTGIGMIVTALALAVVGWISLRGSKDDP